MSRGSLPFPVWLLALDLLATTLLAVGLMVRFAPEVVAGLGLPASLAWPLIVIGALGMVACGVVLVRRLPSRR